MSTDWRRAIETQREEKDRYFGGDPHSPIPPDERELFDGLEYYSIDEAYRFELPLHEYNDPESVTVETSTDGEREYLRWGEFRFTVDGEDITLQAYKADPDDERLWVPFRDTTSGDETYGAGRYLDLESDAHRTNDRNWILDFNEAYTRRVPTRTGTSARSRRRQTGSRCRSRPAKRRITELRSTSTGRPVRPSS